MAASGSAVTTAAGGSPLFVLRRFPVPAFDLAARRYRAEAGWTLGVIGSSGS